MTTAERENFVATHYENMLIQQKSILRLLQASKDIKNGIVSNLRIEVIKYVNNTEKYIVLLEIDNFELTVKLRPQEIKTAKTCIPLIEDIQKTQAETRDQFLAMGLKAEAEETQKSIDWMDQYKKRKFNL